jgi:hypothetical protein
MVSKHLAPDTMAMVQPKAKRLYKTKKEKEKEIVLENLTTIRRDMMERDLSERKEQSVKDLMEEEVKMTLRKTKKKKGKDMVGSNKVPTWEKMPSPMSKSRGGIEASMGLPIKMPPMAPKKSKGKEKVLNPNEESFIHVNNL